MAVFNREPTWQIILNAAKEIGKTEFSSRDIVKLIRNKGYIITETSIQSHIIGMAPNHPSSIHQPYLRDNIPVFDYLGNGLYSINDNFQMKDISTLMQENIQEISETDFSLPIVDSSRMIINPNELGEFYILIRDFENDLRGFIKNSLGKGIYKRLKKELPEVISEWEIKKNIEKNWGIPVESDLINYALLSDYMIIFRKFTNMFTVGGVEELATVSYHLKQFATYGRNPFMHCRTLSMLKYYTTISAVNYLKEWIRRIHNKTHASAG